MVIRNIVGQTLRHVSAAFRAGGLKPHNINLTGHVRLAIRFRSFLLDCPGARQDHQFLWCEHVGVRSQVDGLSSAGFSDASSGFMAGRFGAESEPVKLAEGAGSVGITADHDYNVARARMIQLHAVTVTLGIPLAEQLQTSVHAHTTGCWIFLNGVGDL